MVDPYEVGTTTKEFNLMLEKDIRSLNPKLFRASLKKYIKKIEMDNPKEARKLERMFFDPFNEKVEEMAKLIDIENVVKEYPGNKKGPLPEDDPDHYTEWFINNFPREMVWPDGKEDWTLLGVKIK